MSAREAGNGPSGQIMAPEGAPAGKCPDKTAQKWPIFVLTFSPVWAIFISRFPTHCQGSCHWALIYAAKPGPPSGRRGPSRLRLLHDSHCHFHSHNISRRRNDGVQDLLGFEAKASCPSLLKRSALRTADAGTDTACHRSPPGVVWMSTIQQICTKIGRAHV